MMPLGAILLLVAYAAHAGSVDDLCPGATDVLASARFPVNASADINKGTVEVDFTIRTDGSVADAAVHSSSDPSFEPAAVDAVSKLSCSPQSSDRRLRLPVDFVRPLAVTSDICPNYQAVAQGLSYPRAASVKGYESGEVLIEFKLAANGEIPEFYVLRSTHETFTITALRGLAQLKCVGVGRDIRVRVPFTFRR